MLSRLTDTKYWIKVLAASISTSLIIFISFIIKNFIKRRKKVIKNKKLDYIKQTPSDFVLEFTLIFICSFISYVIVYIVLGLDL